MKNSIKRAVALTVVAVMLLCMAPFVYAADFSASVGSASAQPGETITVDVAIDSMPYENIGCFHVEVLFDTSVLSYDSYTAGSIVDNPGDLDIAESVAGTAVVAFTTADVPLTEAGTVASLSFTVKSGAVNGTYDLKIQPGAKLTNYDAETLISKKDLADYLMDGTVTITGGTDAPEGGDDVTPPDDGDDDVTPPDDGKDDEVVEDITILEADKVYLTVNSGLSANDVISRLPDTVTVTADAAWNGSSKTGEWNVSWTAKGANFIGSQAGEYTFTGELLPKEGYIISDKVVVQAIVTVSKPQSSQGGLSGIGSNPILGAIVSDDDEEEEEIEIRFVIGGTSFTMNGMTSYMDVAFMYNDAGDRTLVPVRFISEILGYKVDWDDATKNVTITKGDHTIVLTIGSETMYSNGKAVQMDTAPVIYNDRTFVPIRFVAENFGLEVGFDNATQEVTLSNK